MNHFCTISTSSHLYKTFALADSLAANGEATLHVLITDSTIAHDHPTCKFYALNDVASASHGAEIMEKYSSSSDKLRWSLKPVFSLHLQNSMGIEKAVYLDNDIFFYSDFSFLFDELEHHAALLTPHYYRYDPGQAQNWFEANFRVGLYNAGFFGAGRGAKEILDWWARCCIYRCEKNFFRGFFDDQKYLDLVPVVFQGAKILRHQGCNVAGWNKETLKRSKTGNAVIINGEFPVVFVHYNNYTIREIENGNDNELIDYYNAYVQALQKYKPELKASDLYVPEPVSDKIKFAIWKVATQLGV